MRICNTAYGYPTLRNSSESGSMEKMLRNPSSVPMAILPWGTPVSLVVWRRCWQIPPLFLWLSWSCSGLLPGTRRAQRSRCTYSEQPAHHSVVCCCLVLCCKFCILLRLSVIICEFTVKASAKKEKFIIRPSFNFKKTFSAMHGLKTKPYSKYLHCTAFWILYNFSFKPKHMCKTVLKVLKKTSNKIINLTNKK